MNCRYFFPFVWPERIMLAAYRQNGSILKLRPRVRAIFMNAASYRIEHIQILECHIWFSSLCFFALPQSDRYTHTSTHHKRAVYTFTLHTHTHTRAQVAVICCLCSIQIAMESMCSGLKKLLTLLYFNQHSERTHTQTQQNRLVRFVCTL